MTRSVVLTLAHSSGRFDVSAHARASYLRAVAQHHGVDLLTTTEDEQRGIVALIRRALAPLGYRVHREREYVTAWRRTVFTPTLSTAPGRLGRVRAVVHRLTRTSGFPLWRQLFVSRTRLRHRALDVPVLAWVAHTPAGVQNGKKWRTATATDRRAVATWLAGTGSWGAAMRTRQARQPNLLQIAGGDFNLDMHDPDWREHVTRSLGVDPIPDHLVPPRGSHGARLIDGVFVLGGAHLRVEYLSWHVSPVKRPRGMDHAAVIVRIRVTLEDK